MILLVTLKNKQFEKQIKGVAKSSSTQRSILQTDQAAEMLHNIVSYRKGIVNITAVFKNVTAITNSLFPCVQAERF